jgi:hypothetical protein
MTETETLPTTVDKLPFVVSEPTTTNGKTVVGVFLEVRGKMFAAGVDASPGSFTLTDRIRFAKLDLVKFIDEFYYFGCGGENHVFDGDASNPALYLECTKCGAAKLENMRYPECLGSVSPA